MAGLLGRAGGAPGPGLPSLLRPGLWVSRPSLPRVLLIEGGRAAGAPGPGFLASYFPACQPRRLRQPARGQLDGGSIEKELDFRFPLDFRDFLWISWLMSMSSKSVAKLLQSLDVPGMSGHSLEQLIDTYVANVAALCGVKCVWRVVCVVAAVMLCVCSSRVCRDCVLCVCLCVYGPPCICVRVRGRVCGLCVVRLL